MPRVATVPDGVRFVLFDDDRVLSASTPDAHAATIVRWYVREAFEAVCDGVSAFAALVIGAVEIEGPQTTTALHAVVDAVGQGDRIMSRLYRDRTTHSSQVRRLAKRTDGPSLLREIAMVSAETVTLAGAHRALVDPVTIEWTVRDHPMISVMTEIGPIGTSLSMTAAHHHLGLSVERMEDLVRLAMRTTSLAVLTSSGRLRFDGDLSLLGLFPRPRF